MKAKRSPKTPAKVPSVQAAAAAEASSPSWRRLIILAAFFAAFLAYGPALDGPFLLDDLYLPYGRPEASTFLLDVWTAQRPLLGLTFYLNYLWSGPGTYFYHFTNVVLHTLTAALAFFLVREALATFAPEEKRRDLLSGFAAALFLLHPVHAEAVAYIASRSDILSTLFCYAALVVFLYLRTATLSLLAIAIILLLFGAGVLSKEQAAILPAAFLIIDFLAPDRHRNWRLHLTIFAAGAAGIGYVFTKLTQADTAGFGTTGVTWYQYLFTQCRAFWRYLILSIFPVDLNVDPDFPISRTITEHGAFFALIAILLLVGVVIWNYRSYPLALAGLLIFLALLAPTSSFIPIKDPFAERRLYFPFIGLLLVVVDLVRRIRLPERTLTIALAAVLCLFGILTYVRTGVWSSEMALWQDSVSKSPGKWRPRFQLAYALYQSGRCDEAAREFSVASTLPTPEGKPDVRLYVDWALALDCANHPEEALVQARRAAQVENNAAVQATIAMLHGKQGRNDEALAALDRAQSLDPKFAMTYFYRGNVYASRNRWPEALEQYQTALRWDPANALARQGLEMARRQLPPK